ncbi:MAG: S-layer homology domain-containing protein [Firmicutes bacterium]|nr:S-layer homology domain-containing protein [Bacillota bacterium]MCL5038370.1 S-layer homology domain-containing protein [Bacillota bacterium]
MKSLRKLLVTLLVVTMVLGMVGVASAAAPSFTDIKGNAAEKDILKLAALGVVEGVGDGKFEPDRSLTRAEFAKVAVNLMGLGDSAKILQGAPSVFSDVKTDDWFNGYVNVAYAQGYVKGYGDGKFGPNDKINQAQAATILLRLLGYNDNLPGEWPLDYVMKAAQLGVVSSSTFNASADTTRGMFATMAVATMGQTKVAYSKDTNSFSDVTGSPKLMADMSSTSLTTGYAIAAADVASFSTSSPKINNVAVSGDVVLVGAAKLSDLANKTVKYYAKSVSGTNTITYVEVTTSSVAGLVKSVDAVNGTLTLDNGTVVTLAASPTLKKNGNDASLIDLVNSNITALLDSSGKAYRVEGYKLDITGALSAKTTSTNADGTVSNKITVGAVDYSVGSTTTIVRNGAAASYADLAVNDDIKMSANGNTAVYVDAFNQTVTGVVASFTTTADGSKVATVTIGSTNYNVAKDSAGVPVIPSASFTVGQSVKFNLDRSGNLASVASASASTASAKLSGVNVSVTSAGTTYSVSLDDGTSYTVVGTATVSRNGTAAANFNAGFGSLKTGDAVKLTVGADGKVTEIKAYGDFNDIPGTFDGATHPALNTLVNTDGSTAITLNGLSQADTTGISGATATSVRIAWNGATGYASKIEAVNFPVSNQTVTGKATSVSGSTTSYIVYTVETPAGITLASGATVKKDGAASNFDAIAVGNKISSGPVSGTANKYVEATTDATATTITVGSVAGGSLTVTFNEPVKLGKVTVIHAGVATTTDVTAGATSVTVTAAVGDVIGVQVTDYAGNSASTSTTAQ